MEAIQIESLNSQEKKLKSKGIDLAHQNDHRRCKNCNTNTRSKYSVHKIEVNDNH